MTARSCTSEAHTGRRRGLTLVEMVISMVLVGVMLVTALNTVGAAKLGQRKLYGRLHGHQLAEDLLTEILQQEYADAATLKLLKTEILIDRSTVTQPLGPEAGEDTGDRSLFDDIDDYDGWSASPPQQQDGTELSHLADWRREVSVQYVKDDQPTELKTKDEGAKLITVTVAHDDLPVAELTALRTIGLPPTEACCLSDDTCVDLPSDCCTSLGGTPQGADTVCAQTECTANTSWLRIEITGKVESTDLTRGPFAGIKKDKKVTISFLIDTDDDIGYDAFHRYRAAQYTITVDKVSMTAAGEPTFGFTTFFTFHSFDITSTGLLRPDDGSGHKYTVPTFGASGPTDIWPPERSEPQDHLDDFKDDLFDSFQENRLIDEGAGGPGVDQELVIKFDDKIVIAPATP